MNQRIIITYIVLLAFMGLVAFVYISRSSNNLQANYQQSDFEDRVKQVIKNNPEFIVQTVMQWQQAKMAQEKSLNNANAAKVYDMIINDESLPKIGQGEVKVIEFYDYLCGYCKKMSALKKKYANKVGFISIATPVLGRDSEYLAKVTAAFHYLVPENFSEVHFAILDSAPRSNIKQLVADLLAKYNISKDEFENALNSDEVKEALAKNNFYASKAGINATPAYIIDGTLQMGALPEAKFAQLIENAK